MELYVINENSELVSYNKVRYEKKEYTGELLEKILKSASEYHLKEGLKMEIRAMNMCRKIKYHINIFS